MSISGRVWCACREHGLKLDHRGDNEDLICWHRSGLLPAVDGEGYYDGPVGDKSSAFFAVVESNHWVSERRKLMVEDKLVDEVVARTTTDKESML